MCFCPNISFNCWSTSLAHSPPWTLRAARAGLALPSVYLHFPWFSCLFFCQAIRTAQRLPRSSKKYIGYLNIQYFFRFFFPGQSVKILDSLDQHQAPGNHIPVDIFVGICQAHYLQPFQLFQGCFLISCCCFGVSFPSLTLLAWGGKDTQK